MARPLPPGPSLPRQRWGLVLALFVLAFITTSAFGTGFYLATRTDIVTDLVPDPALLLLGHPGDFFSTLLSIPLTVWTTPALLRFGLLYSLPLMAILLAHELGHYFACRKHGIAATLPFFLPAPFLIGTLGAFIRIRGGIKSRKQLLDIGAAGPIAGFLMLLPFLVIGFAKSRPAAITEVDFEIGESLLYVPGAGLATRWLVDLLHGPLSPGTVIDLHPFALAAWVGLLVTSLNLIPAGQLDGGHILYAVSPRWYRRLRPALIVALIVLGFFWPPWWIWCGIVLLVARRHPPLERPYELLDRPRLAIAVTTLVIFVITFMIVPISIIAVLV